MQIPELPEGIRPAHEGDLSAILEMIVELAVYEREPDAVRTTTDDLHRVLFGPDAATYALIAERDNEQIGFALWFRNFSTWDGVYGIYLEDLYVRPAARGTGSGKKLLQSLAAIAAANGYSRFEWSVLNWNKPSIDFYEAMGAYGMTDWTRYRLEGDALTKLANS